MSKALKEVSASNSCLLCLLHWQAGSLPAEPSGKPTEYINSTETWRRNFPEEGGASSEALGSGMTSMFEEARGSQSVGANWAAQRIPRDHDRF